MLRDSSNNTDAKKKPKTKQIVKYSFTMISVDISLW